MAQESINKALLTYFQSDLEFFESHYYISSTFLASFLLICNNLFQQRSYSDQFYCSSSTASNLNSPWDSFYNFKTKFKKLFGIKIITYQENFERDNTMATNYSQACGEDCPEYMYEYNKIKESWISFCSQKSGDYGVEAIKFFKRVYNRHLSKSVFVTAFDCNDSAKLFVDFILYNRVKAKLQRFVGFKVPHIGPTRLSKRRLPRRKHMFASEGDFNRCIENLRRKNNEILFQKNVRAIRLLDQIREHISEKDCKILALDLEVYEKNPSDILEIGCVLFRMVSLETRSQVLTCNHYIIRDNKHLKNECLIPDNRDRFRFGVTQEISISEAKKVIEDLSRRVEYITAHAAENLTAYLQERGIDIREVKVIDTKLLHTAVSPFVGDHVQRDLRWIMNDLEIPLDMNNNTRADEVMDNAGNDAFYTMEVFTTLVRMRPIETELI